MTLKRGIIQTGIQVFCALLLFTANCPAEAEEKPLTLTDDLTVEDFVQKYNNMAEYKIVDYANHKQQGNYETYLAGIDKDNIIIINAVENIKPVGIVILHKGVMDEASVDKVADVFRATVLALGFLNDDLNGAIIDRAYQRLGMENKVLQSSAIKREDKGRVYIFIKSYNDKNDVYSLAVSAKLPDEE